MKLCDPKTRVLTVHPSATIRQLINVELRARGYIEVVGVPDLSDAAALMATDPFQWLITPPQLGSAHTVFSFLRLAAEEPSYHSLRISLICDEELDDFGLSKAFELGLLSYHRSLSTKAEISEAFSQLQEREGEAKGRLDLVAAAYLRQLLSEGGRCEERMRLERSLFQMHRGHAPLAFELADAHIRVGERRCAARLLAQLALIDPSWEKKGETLWAESGLGALPSMVDPGGEVLGLSSCMIVEPDVYEREQLEQLLRRMGVGEVLNFADTTAALRALEEGAKPEIILFEWSCHPLPGPVFAQRLRELLGHGVPLTTLSRELSEQDMPLLREMGISQRIPKPLSPASFYRELVWLMHEDRQPSEPLFIMQKIRQAMAEGDTPRLAQLTRSYMENESCSATDRCLLQAELAYHRGSFEAARELALQVMKSGVASVEVLNLMGKTLMKLRDFPSALQCFETAQIISPKHIRRLCNIAESQLENGEEKAYEATLSRVEALDAGSEALAETQLKGALVKGESARAQQLMHSLRSLLTILSFTNNRAIAQIRCALYDEGINLYREALAAVPENRREIKGILRYNLALALARLGRLDEALVQLTSADIAEAPKVSGKAQNLRRRVERSLKSGQPFLLKAESQAPLEAEADSYQELMRSFRISPGDCCLHQIWSEGRIDARLKALIDRPLPLGKAGPKAS